MAAGPSAAEPRAAPELGDAFKRPCLPAAPAVRGPAAPGAHPPGPEDVTAAAPDAGHPDATAARPEPGEPEGGPEGQPRAPAALPPPHPPPPPGGPARAPPYREPPWGSPAPAPYGLETLKGGAVLGARALGGASRCLFGRLPGCDVCLEHPSVSRHHAVLQHGAPPPGVGVGGGGPGFYLYDLGSTHGTFLNKTRIPPRTYCRVHVGHVLRFGGSTRLFVLQGPEEDREAESELTVTQLKEMRKQQQMMLERKMLGDDSDEEEMDTDSTERKRAPGGPEDEMGCTWGMGEDAVEDEAEENPIVLEFQQEREAFYIKDPKKALQGFFDREGEELEYEFDEQGHSTWLCRVRLPVDDSTGKQLVAEAIHSGKKKEAMMQCSLEACRILDTLGLLRQEAVSRKRKTKNWEDEDFYDSDDDTFLDRTGLVEKKRLNRMKKAGKIDEKPETFESLVAKLNDAEKELSEISEKLKASSKALSESPSQDSLDAFMSEMKSGSALDGVSRKKLHLRTFELRKEQQRLKGLIKIVKPAEIPELKKTDNKTPDAENKAKKLTLPLFGAMKGGSKFKLKTGTVGKLPPKRPELPSALLTTKDEPEVEEEEEEEEEEDQEKTGRSSMEAGSSRLQQETEPEEAAQEVHPPADHARPEETGNHGASPSSPQDLLLALHSGITPGGVQGTIWVPGVTPGPAACMAKSPSQPSRAEQSRDYQEIRSAAAPREEPSASEGENEKSKDEVKKKKAPGPAKLPPVLSSKYPEDDPDYCVWVPPEGQSGDGRTHLNDKYGY